MKMSLFVKVVVLCTQKIIITYNTLGIEHFVFLLPLEEQYFRNKDLMESDVGSRNKIVI